MDYFLFESNKVVLNKEAILLIKEFATLWDSTRNKIEGDTRGHEKKRAYREFTYMYLMYDWESPYKSYSDMERHQNAVSDSELTKKQFEDELFQTACKKYQDIQDTRMLKLLKSANRAIDEIRLFYENLDLQERDVDGRPIFNAKQVLDSLGGLGKTVLSLETLEAIVQKQKEGEGSKLRGDVMPGMFD